MKKQKAIKNMILGALIIATGIVLVIIIPGYCKFLIAAICGPIGGGLIGINYAKYEHYKKGEKNQ